MTPFYSSISCIEPIINPINKKHNVGIQDIQNNNIYQKFQVIKLIIAGKKNISIANTVQIITKPFFIIIIF